MWSTPKTDWYGVGWGDSYQGDRFDAVDFNRIKNNLKYLRDLAIKMYDSFDIEFIETKTFENYFYADEINRMEANLDAINRNSLNQDYGTAPTYVDYGGTMDYNELNRLESAILDLYDKLTNEHDGRRTFTWNFGMKGGL